MNGAEDMWLVIHIPKTAGTSFRWALEKRFGKSQIICDYGPDSNSTSEIVQTHLYVEKGSENPANLINELSGGDAKVLMGHFPLQKYARHFKPENIISFVREPLARTCSEYLHRLNNNTFEGSLCKFLQQPGFQNQQSRLLKGVSELSFVGITERYGDCLSRLNDLGHWKLSVRKKNVGRAGGGRKLAEGLTEKELEFFNEVNQEDLEFYQQAKGRFDAVETSARRPGFLNWLNRN